MLALNLGLPGFETLPLHADLLVFRNFKFPKSPAGKAAALDFVYGMAYYPLRYSPISDDLNGVIFNEIAN